MFNILVVEDSLTILYSIEHILEQHGYGVTTAGDGVEALRLAADLKPDVILLDVILPKINGYQVCRQLKSAPDTAHIPIIMLTSKAKDSDRYWGMEQGADGYLTKPYGAHDLLDAIGQFAPQRG